ncbi:hypothetical protein ASPWEDRAFT_162858 [Aspergillus wentii DTO 134E9]|uniref:Cytochrome P450 n=1 Tax=Aspergillus wentii DTO 134E9 TaxID=1073089 RepID=A0A1L9R892_ASPWE|nr:uncharacterized protein ASPWEDRAFT_162858 [Aspergillus wentii DTO 134E9]KAI9924943.1 hypothetical protein MW887_006350 [Aspergillus wentii]OJJ31108.1 hypothetical protein ASPWEDRAFT_162858 [Aspergillus wentii DTO 134E9]
MALPFFVVVAAAAVVLRLLWSIVTSIQHARRARQLGCGPTLLYPSDPLGISTLKESLKADKEKDIPMYTQRRVDFMSDRENRYVSTFRVRTMGRENLFTCDPKNIQALLATQFKDFDLGAIRQHSLNDLLGTGIFTADGEDWTRSRALLRPQFTRDQISDLDLEERHVQNAMQALPVAADGWSGQIDIQTIFFRLTMDSATEFLFGESVDSQLAALKGDKSAAEFPFYFDRSQWYAAQRVRFEKLHWIVNNKESRHSDKQVHSFVDRFVDAALKGVQDEKTKKDEEKPSNYVFLHGLAAVTQDPIELRSQLLNILLAGRDTTASLLSWTVLLLARHPEVFQKLRKIIVEEFGTYENPQNITFASLKSCQYLQHCMNEVLRLYPVVPMNRRTAVRDTTLPLGGGPDGSQPVYVTKGQAVMYNVHILHRRKDLWGPDADSFIPERWVNRKVTWDYLPFNGGPRICIGQQFALTEAGYVLVRLLQRFDGIEDVHPEQKIRHGLTLTSCPADLVTVRLHAA